MMNLELLFEATQLSGYSTFYHIAVSHANTTLKTILDPTTLVSMWWTTTPKRASCATDKRHKGMPTTATGRADKPGRSMDIRFAIVIHTTKSILTKRKRWLTLSTATVNYQQT